MYMVCNGQSSKISSVDGGESLEIPSQVEELLQLMATAEEEPGFFRDVVPEMLFTLRR